jgi:hypothetical protein
LCESNVFSGLGPIPALFRLESAPRSLSGPRPPGASGKQEHCSLRLRKTEENVAPTREGASWPGLSRPSTGLSDRMPATSGTCKKTLSVSLYRWTRCLEIGVAARRGWPGQARALTPWSTCKPGDCSKPRPSRARRPRAGDRGKARSRRRRRTRTRAADHGGRGRCGARTAIVKQLCQGRRLSDPRYPA